MPKPPRISGAEAQRALERLESVKLRQSGSHVIMRRESKGCVVPMHAALKVAVVRRSSPTLALYPYVYHYPSRNPLRRSFH